MNELKLMAHKSCFAALRSAKEACIIPLEPRHSFLNPVFSPTASPP